MSNNDLLRIENAILLGHVRELRDQLDAKDAAIKLTTDSEKLLLRERNELRTKVYDQMAELHSLRVWATNIEKDKTALQNELGALNLRTATLENALKRKVCAIYIIDD